MDLHSGTPYWIIKNALYSYNNPLTQDIRTTVAVIGSGITGALVAHELCRSGIECVVIDKRSAATGSTAASTALLQYEIDVPLHKMKDMVGEQAAACAYKSCLRAISDLRDIFAEIGADPSFGEVPSLYYASDERGRKTVEAEADIRRKHDLPFVYLDSNELYRLYRIEAPCALMNDSSGQLDSYQAAVTLLEHDRRRHDLALYTHTEIKKCERRHNGFVLKTGEGLKIKCDYVVVAAGFEAGPFLPAKLMNLTTTYVIISEPVEPQVLWHGESLIWETRNPYLYIRTEGGNRIIIGGEDEPFNNAPLRQQRMLHKSEVLRRKFKKLFPHIPFRTEMQWAGTFSSTRDGLPLIGSTRHEPNMIYALGYGGNGITFSVIAAQIIANRLRGREDRRGEIFGFSRPTLKL